MSVWHWFYLDKGGFFPVFCLASLTFTRWWFVLCFVFNAFFFSIQSSPCFLFYEGVLRPGSDCHFFARNRANCFELYMFYFFYFFSGSIKVWCCVFTNVLTIFMVEEFYIYAVVQFYFSSREKLMYEINQSHVLKNKSLFKKKNAMQYP